MWYVKWTFRIVLAAFLLAFFHYTLPQRDIVRIVSTETRRVDFGANSIFWANSGAGDAVNTVNRDILFIEAVRENGSVIVYRNEDTGWGWPPYYKFDTADLQAEASDLISTKDAPQWVVVKHYGWRSTWLSIFPNAVKVKPIEDPNVTLIPWGNIVIIIVLLAIFRTIQVRVRRFWRRIRGTEEELET